MKKDYEIRNGLEEWIGGVCRITEGFRRLVVHTEKAQKALWRLFRKIVPLDAVVKLTPKEADRMRSWGWKMPLRPRKNSPTNMNGRTFSFLAPFL